MGDLLSYDDMRQAVKGMDYMYYAFAVQDGLLEGSSIAAVVAAEAGTPLHSLYNTADYCLAHEKVPVLSRVLVWSSQAEWVGVCPTLKAWQPRMHVL